MKNIAFIVNPISGTKAKNRVGKLIRELLDLQQFAPTVVVTEYAGHATQLAQQFAMQEYYAVVAVGGDGTVNEVASGLIGSNTALGIIPNGSGNGFARHLDISTRMNRAIEMLNSSEVINVDYGMVNDKPFFSTCGVGFDAVVAEKFSDSERGLKGYVQTIFKDLFQYKPESYHLKGQDIDMTTTAFLVNFANASQWGYDAYIAPKASIQDGWLDVAVVSEFPMVAAAGLALSLFTKNIDEKLHMNTLRTKELTLTRESEGVAHIDGTPITMPAELHVRIVEDGLKVLVKKRF
ncbi:MAG: YegS/Rv2252/BmrU family lipid kinase [Paludibacteraceae bacterium]|jgi:YegS/Rv2252/BmrU family lipid kinase|nr:YegS/Rv2252/BmrU family lipid kinase [Paludibacteraceae bacterium]